MIRRGMWIAIILAIGTIGVLGIRAQLSVRAHPYDRGQNGPGFNLLSQDGSPVSLAQFRGKWVVLFAYSQKDLHIYLPDYLLQVPSTDASSENDIEVRAFQQDLPKYKALNAEVVGLSPDSIEEHKAFAAKEGLRFPLLTPDTRLWDGLGVPISGTGENTSVERDTFLISPSGFIAKVWFVKDVQSHSDEVLSTIRAVQQPGYVIDSLRESPI